MLGLVSHRQPVAREGSVCHLEGISPSLVLLARLGLADEGSWAWQRSEQWLMQMDILTACQLQSTWIPFLQTIQAP